MLWRKFIYVAVVLVFALSGCADVGDDTPNDYAALADGAISLVSESAREIVFHVVLPELTLTEAETELGVFTRLEAAGYPYYGQVGEPALPALREIVSLPLGARVTVTAEPLLVDTIALDHPVLPNQPPVEKLPGALENREFVYDADAYSIDAYTVGRFAAMTEEGMMRNHRLGMLEITPIDYNPAGGELLVARELRVTVHLNGADIAATQEMAREYGVPAFDAILGNQAANPGKTWNLFSQPTAGAAYLIIYANTFASSSALNQFKTLKQNDGWTVHTASMSDVGSNTVVGIRNFIIEKYDAIPSLTFVLLVGDTDTIAGASGFASNYPATDIYYSCMNSTDYYPDLLLGRFPARTEAQLANMVAKTAAYEAAAGLKTATFMASTDNYSITEGTHNTVINYFLSPHSYTVNKLYTVTYSATTQQVKNAINAGTNYAIYSGHGSETSWADGPAFSQSDVASLTNTRYPFVCSFACLTGKYTLAESFAETWLRDDHAGVAMIASSVTSYWDEDDWFEKAMFLGMFNFPWTGYPDQIWAASAMLCGKFGVWRMSNFGGGSSHRYFEMYNLFGDPSLEVYTY